MVSDDATKLAALNMTVGVVVAGLGNLVGGILGGFAGFFGLVLYAVVAIPALYLGLRFVALGVGVVVEDALADRPTPPGSPSSEGS
jgi:ABC-type transport system involved in cytochrome c biogenesis permease subunit